ncbi:MAG: hypothetical protein M5U26_04265 [Planctomycetota bacterium]|nr:hypothetical protein [Planctomycetota bacterium]
MSYRTMRAAALLACCAWAAAGEEPAYTPRPKDTLTWSRDIAPIVYKHCASCHRPGEVAPFPLLEYKDAAKRDVQIALAVESRLMPPWKPAPGYGSFHDERRLSADEIGAIRQWVDEGAREGDPKDLPAQPKFTEGWQLGEPDLVVEMPEAFTCPAEGRDVYRNFVLPVPLKEERYVRAVEFRPGNRAVVHHAILYLDTSGWARKRDEADPAPGYASLGGPGIIPPAGWAAGRRARRSTHTRTAWRRRSRRGRTSSRSSISTRRASRRRSAARSGCTSPRSRRRGRWRR